MLSISVKIPDLKKAFKTCASGTDACPEHAHQELMRALIIRAKKFYAPERPFMHLTV
jgi:hypothetical protein